MSTPITPDRRAGFCGIDIGTQGVRCVIVDEDGRLLGSGSAPIPAGERAGGRHEQDPLHWWTSVVLAVSDAVRQAGVNVRIEAVAMDATSGTVLVEAADGAASGRALMYDDARAAGQAERAQRVGAQLWDALGYRMQASWALPKMMWLLENGAVAPGERLVHQVDHLLRRLTGRSVPTDTSHALKTGVDLRSATWPVDILGDLGVSTVLLPEVVLPGVRVGKISAEAASVTGLTAGTPVMAGMTDGCAAQIATGALRPGRWSSALGTTLVIKGSTAELIHDPHGAVYSHRNPDGGWLPGGASSTGAGVLNTELEHHDQRSLEMLTDLARPLIPFPGSTYALSGTGERFPFVAPQARGFIAAEAIGEPARFAALCQSIAYVERLSYDVLGSLGADVSGIVALSGGASRNTWWNQLRTDVLGRETVVPESVQAATGMAILAAAGDRGLSATAERMVRIGETYTPDPARGEQLRPGYQRLVEELADRGWLDTGLASNVLTSARSTT